MTTTVSTSGPALGLVCECETPLEPKTADAPTEFFLTNFLPDLFSVFISLLSVLSLLPPVPPLSLDPPLPTLLTRAAAGAGTRVDTATSGVSRFRNLDRNAFLNHLLPVPALFA